MQTSDFHSIFTPDRMKALFPSDRADRFFEALYGDTDDGAYDIAVAFIGANRHQLSFEFQLTQRPGKCLACNLTYGLPTVFQRHPIINVPGLVEEIGKLVDDSFKVDAWEIGPTREISRERHIIPLNIDGSESR